MTAYLSEAIGTFVLIFVGLLTAILSGGNVIMTSLAFGVTLSVLILTLGTRSGAHVNPAVTLGAWLHGSLSTHDTVPYWIAQLIGAVFAGGILFLLPLPSDSLGEAVAFGKNTDQVFLAETGVTFAFVFVVLLLGNRTMPQSAFAIGTALLIGHLVLLLFLGTASINPARAITPIVFSAHKEAAAQLWIFVTAPFLGGGFAGVMVTLLKGMKKK